MAVSTHPQDLSLREQARAVAAGELDPRELLDATLARIEERDPPLNSIVDRFPSQAERMLASAPAGPLRGVPLTIKDQFSLPWRAPRDGAHNTPSGVEAGESGVFRRLRDAGAVIVGVANMHEFGLGSTGHLSIYGPCANPWDVSRCAGGSSSGSAAAVAARLVAGAVGTDGGGSIRFPSAYCGVTGLKLTWGQIPTDGLTFGRHSLATAGPICRDAADARILGEALLGRPLERRDTKGLRLGIPRSHLWGDLDQEVEQSCTAALDTLAATGIEIEEVPLAGVEHALISTVLLLSLEGVPSDRPDLIDALMPHLSPLIRALLKYQLLTPAVALVKAERARAQVRRQIAEIFADVDALAWPTAPAPAPPIEDPTVSLP